MDAAGDVDARRCGSRPQDGEHVGRDLDAIDVDAGGKEVEQQSAAPAADVEDGLAELLDEFEVERSIRPTGGVASYRVPGARLEADVFEIHRHQASLRSPSSARNPSQPSVIRSPAVRTTTSPRPAPAPSRRPTRRRTRAPAARWHRTGWRWRGPAPCRRR